MVLRPLISIIGTTGVGKSRLAIELALALSGGAIRDQSWNAAKVINSDSMQVYSGADIITNKVQLSERQGVEHLLIGFKEPGEQYVVGQWVIDAIREIDELHCRKTVPIVVGGTAYWMQHLIFPNRLTSLDNHNFVQDRKVQGPTVSQSSALQAAICSLPESLLELFLNLPEKPEPEQAFSLHALLASLDPRVASRWHWKDTRKVLRNLEIIKEKGLLASEVLAQQAEGGADPPRYPTLIFWLYSHPDELHKRLDARAEEMIQQGLLDDVRFLRRLALSTSSPADASEIDTTSGIFQAIGFKEFNNYVSLVSPSPQDYEEAIEKMKISNRQYAKQQVQWIRKRLIPAANSAKEVSFEIPIYLLNVGDLDKWNSNIRDVAVQIALDFLQGRELVDPRSLSETAAAMLNDQTILKSPTATLIARHKVTCEICTTDSEQPTMVDEGEWAIHLKSRKHKKFRRVHERTMNPLWRGKQGKMASNSNGLNSDSEDNLNLDLTNKLYEE